MLPTLSSQHPFTVCPPFLHRYPRLFQECLTPASTIELLEACKKGNPPKMGRWGSLPMNGQVSCEGPHGKTTLKEPAPAPGFMMRKDLDGNVDPATVKRDMHY
jgi:NADH dehydrogenase (ubiquinone) flavoprotein 2